MQSLKDRSTAAGVFEAYATVHAPDRMDQALKNVFQQINICEPDAKRFEPTQP